MCIRDRTNALHLLEYRLAEAGHPTAGFVLLIPHYLSDTEYPICLLYTSPSPRDS